MTYFSQLPPEDTTPKRVGFIGFGGMTTLDLTAPLEAFATARLRDGAHAEPAYETCVIAVERKTF
ncbi:MAG TPA: hypothetical protein VF551_10075, partial [Chthoniobacterales bacterium]